METHFARESTLVDSFLTVRENQDIHALLENLDELNSVILALQRESTDLAFVRLLFDKIVTRVPDFNGQQQRYLLPKSPIVKYPDFESGVEKITDKADDSLTKDEEFACRQLLLKDVVEGNLAVITSTRDFARDEIEKKRQRMQVTGKYIDCTFIEPWSVYSAQLVIVVTIYGNHLPRFISKCSYF